MFEEKIALRIIMSKKRNKISIKLQKKLSYEIYKRLIEFHIYKKARSVACYYSKDSEVKTMNIMQNIIKTKELLLPKKVGHILEFKKIKDLTKLEDGIFGIKEPNRVCQTSHKIDLVLVPAIAISRRGERIGYGHGYYDRVLSTLNTKTISLVYAKQIIDKIPTSKNDINMDFIINENEILQCNY